jgi:hypothetical protein
MITDWMKPYTFKRKSLMRSWPWLRTYNILFEDTVVLVSGDHEEAATIVACLNGAYNLGRGQGHLEALRTMV